MITFDASMTDSDAISDFLRLISQYSIENPPHFGHALHRKQYYNN
jgi:hypothetical protein